MKSSNPLLKEKIFSPDYAVSDRMSLNGVVNKSFLLLGMLFLSAFYVWQQFSVGQSFSSVSGYLIVGAIGGLILAVITSFKPNLSGITAPIYAVLEGLFIGGISAYMEMRFPGIVFQAVSLTFAVFFTMLFLYRTGIIKVTAKFKMMVVSATGAIFLFYMLSFILSFFGISMPLIHDTGIFGIGFSLFVVGLAAFNLVLDFDFIDESVKRGAPKFMEWFGAFALLVTLVWLYIEILRLLSKLRND